MKKIYPKCLHDDHHLGHTARGYLLPCCWSDRPELFEGDMKDLVKDKFKITNIDNIEQVIQSDEWQTFYKDLENGIGRKICYIYCGDNPIKEVSNESG